MRHRSAFTLTDLLASIALVAVLLTVTAATLADNGTNDEKMQNSTQLRAMHQGMVTFANSNREYFPGLDSHGRTLENSPEATGGSGDGTTTEARFWILIKGGFMAPGYAIAPIDRRAIAYELTDDSAQTPVTFDNYSYAMLDIDIDANFRRAEWTRSLNTQAVVMSDRNCSDLQEQEPFSIWDDEQWEGSALWNDNHVAFETTEVMETRYGNGAHNINIATGKGTDALFTEDNPDRDDALMTYSRDEDGNERVVWDTSDREDTQENTHSK